MEEAASAAANAWMQNHHEELVSRAAAMFGRMDYDRREEAVAEVVARTLTWAHSAARRNRLHRLTAYWAVVFASRQYLQGWRVAGDCGRCLMAPISKVRHGLKVASLDDRFGIDDSRSLRESLADHGTEDPFEVVRREIDYPLILEAESVSDKAVATFAFLAQSKSEGKQCELATELRVSAGRVTQLKQELAHALASHDYTPPLGCRPSAYVGWSTASSCSFVGLFVPLNLFPLESLMNQLIQPDLSLLLGIAMTIYGIAHAITQFPDPIAFSNLMANLPAFSSVLLFILGLIAFAAGIMLVVLGIRNMRRRWRRFGQIARHVETQPQYADDDGGWGQAYR